MESTELSGSPFQHVTAITQKHASAPISIVGFTPTPPSPYTHSPSPKNADHQHPYTQPDDESTNNNHHKQESATHDPHTPVAGQKLQELIILTQSTPRL
jgi:hypothetical protein